MMDNLMVDIPNDLNGRILEIEGQPKEIWVHAPGAPSMTQWIPKQDNTVLLTVEALPLESDILMSLYFLAPISEDPIDSFKNFISKYGLTSMYRSKEAAEDRLKSTTQMAEFKDNPLRLLEVQVALDSVRVIE